MFISSENPKLKQSRYTIIGVFSYSNYGCVLHHKLERWFFCVQLQIYAEIYLYFADQKVVTENPIRTTRFASITTPLPVRKNDKFADSGEGLVYDLGNYVFVKNFINLCLIHLLVQKTFSPHTTFFECGQISLLTMFKKIWTCSLTLFNIFYASSNFLTMVKSNILPCKFEYGRKTFDHIQKILKSVKKIWTQGNIFQLANGLDISRQ